MAIPKLENLSNARQLDAAQELLSVTQTARNAHALLSDIEKALSPSALRAVVEIALPPADSLGGSGQIMEHEWEERLAALTIARIFLASDGEHQAAIRLIAEKARKSARKRLRRWRRAQEREIEARGGLK